tara:strand:- start:259 stop:1047 length:789 start_codon:yes stop_codon:yes gene_type:complete
VGRLRFISSHKCNVKNIKENMNIIIIQARLNSTRLPKKITYKLGNISAIDHVIIRAERSVKFKKIVVAVPKDEKSIIAESISNKNIDIFEGSEDDVLSRYYECAKYFSAKNICRITSDCPLIDWRIIDLCFEKYEELGQNLYVANTCPPPCTFPDGMDVEIFPMTMLEKAHNNETDRENREHVTFQFWKDEDYKSYQINYLKDISELRLTLDYNEDLARLKNFIDKFSPNGEDISLEKIIENLQRSGLYNEFKQNHLRNSGW